MLEKSRCAGMTAIVVPFVFGACILLSAILWRSSPSLGWFVLAVSGIVYGGWALGDIADAIRERDGGGR